jgi:hypothetical protein
MFRFRTIKSEYLTLYENHPLLDGGVTQKMLDKAEHLIDFEGSSTEESIKVMKVFDQQHNTICSNFDNQDVDMKNDDQTTNASPDNPTLK